jgi:hypothetical protein
MLCFSVLKELGLATVFGFARYDLYRQCTVNGKAFNQKQHLTKADKTDSEKRPIEGKRH